MSRAQHWPTTRITLLTQIKDVTDEHAWQAFVDLYTPLIHRYCRKRGLQASDAQDVTQEVFSRVSRAINGFDYDVQRGQFRCWLGLITHQQLIRHHSKQQGRVAGLGGGAGDLLCNSQCGEVDAAWIETFNGHIYQAAADRIRDEFDGDTWCVFQQVWESGDQPKEVALRLQRKPEWVYQAKYRVVQRLREEILRLSDDIAICNRE